MVSKQLKLIFLQPPKTASRSLNKCLMNNGFVKSYQSENFPVYKIHLKLDEIVEKYEIESLDGYKVIQITRNPYDKFISSYYHQLRIFEKPEFQGHIPISGYTFDEFLFHLNSTINSENFIESFYGNPDYINYVISNKPTWGGSRFYHTQSSWKNVDCDFYYFKIENLVNDITPLNNLIGLNLPPLESINVNPLEIDYEQHKTETNKQIIKNLFLEDFTNFSY